MKLTYDTEPFEYLSNMRKLQQAVDQIKISSSDVLQFFFLLGMNETFKSQLVSITNNIFPSLDEINENFLAANCSKIIQV